MLSSSPAHTPKGSPSASPRCRPYPKEQGSQASNRTYPHIGPRPWSESWLQSRDEPDPDLGLEELAFEDLDSNGDGVIDRKEWEAAHQVMVTNVVIVTAITPNKKYIQGLVYMKRF